MSRKYVVLAAAILAVFMLTAFSYGQGMFVATAKNIRGALYQGVGPTPNHATEMAMVKCSQDSFIPPSCKVVAVRMECPPPVCAPPMAIRKTIQKARVEAYPMPYPMGRPMP
jgi:hypothetical protein